MKSLLALGFTGSAVAQFVVDPMGNRILSANKAAYRLCKLSEREITDQPLSALFYDCHSELVVFTEEIYDKDTAWSDTLSLRVNNKPMRVEIYATQLQDHKPLAHFSIHDTTRLKYYRDKAEAQFHYNSGIVHWKRSAKAFQEFERENQLLLEAAGEGIYGVDKNGLTTFVNPAAERILGYSAEELSGKNMHLVIHHSHDDGSNFGIHDCPIYQAFRDGIVRTVESDVFWSKQSIPINVEYTSTPIRDNDEIIGAVVIFRDITEKMKDKQRLLSALEEVEQLKERLEQENAYLHQELSSEFNHHRIVGKSLAIQQIIQQIELVAATDATVMVTGESGTGKELIARAIHDLSERNKRPLIRVNCAAIPTELFESEFFGHTKGAFSGAVSDRPGRFELADGGTLFLDEVGEIPLNLQGKLLRVLQEQQFERVGESTTRQVNVRIIAATNKNLMQQVEAGKFREDLYFRLNVFPIESVPLRKRKEDIPLLAQFFLNRMSRPGEEQLKIPLSEIDKLKRYHWPGNIRELENIIERQVILANNGTLRFNNLFNESASTINAIEHVAQDRVSANSVLTENEQKQQEKHNMLMALQKCQGKVFGKNGAAELLGIKPTTLSSRIKKYKIDTQRFKTN